MLSMTHGHSPYLDIMFARLSHFEQNRPQMTIDLNQWLSTCQVWNRSVNILILDITSSSSKEYHIHAYTRTCMRACMQTYKYVHAYIHACIHIHTYMHTNQPLHLPATSIHLETIHSAKECCLTKFTTLPTNALAATNFWANGYSGTLWNFSLQVNLGTRDLIYWTDWVASYREKWTFKRLGLLVMSIQRASWVNQALLFMSSITHRRNWGHSRYGT